MNNPYLVDVKCATQHRTQLDKKAGLEADLLTAHIVVRGDFNCQLDLDNSSKQ